MVPIVNQGTSKNQEIMHLRLCLAFLAAHMEVLMVTTHVKGVENTRADALYRYNTHVLSSLHPQARQRPTPVTERLRTYLSCPNRTGHHHTGHSCGFIFQEWISSSNSKNIFGIKESISAVLLKFRLHNHTSAIMAIVLLCGLASSTGHCTQHSKYVTCQW